jgi:membrane-associated protease RseP (regulator of RpoE activity)
LDTPVWQAPVWAYTAQPPEKPRENYWRHWVLLAATLLTTTLVGVEHWLAFQANFQQPTAAFSLWSLLDFHGLWYSLTIMAILGAHEAGHYLACRYYGIDATLPYFLPVPLPLTGTAGAFIKIRDPITSKRVLFDVGVAGPIAGFAVTVPALIWGVWMSRVCPLPTDFSGVELGEPLLFRAVSWMVWGNIPDAMSLNMHPMAFAAWFGMLATAMNLIPIGQFDGGHVAYAILGRRASWITLGSVGLAVGLSVYSSSWIGWTAIAVLLLWKFGWRHPPTWDAYVPLNPGRKWVALLALLILIACFTFAPISPLDLVGSSK